MAANLKDKLREDLNAARKERDRLRTTVLSSTISEVRNREIELGREAGDEDIIEVLNRAIKRRREAAEQMAAGGRPELAEKEETEAKILGGYMPSSLSEEEVRALVQEAVAGGANNVGAVMSAIMPKIKGRFDGKEANRIAREALT